ncbi:Phenylalanine--tRNA ligase beta subunit [Candidatus Hartigia pinicola]|nr:Phenylalanine--tRNA ligase beta subunit [Candidatus Hartigia pinicola]
MKFSELWLREWVNLTISSEKLANQITMTGLEIDDITSVSEQFDGVIIGQIVECKQHPDADRLHITKINIGNNHVLDIVCGAQNCRQGLKVAVATIGSMLPNNFKIKKVKLRGKLSEGMLCAYSELGIASDTYNSIIELPLDAPIGTNLRQYLTLDDNIIEISITANRADCLSILGIAREVAVINKHNLNEPLINKIIPTIADSFPIRIEVPEACPRFLSRVIKNIDISVPTPIWMKEKLRRSGISSINAVIDITNYVLLELGQPQNAYDFDCLHGALIIRMAKKNEKLVLLDSRELILESDTLVISDEKKTLGIAGICNGKYSQVSSQTKNILLECAFFNPLSITGRARYYGLQNNASYRFERGVDFKLQFKAIERATQLIFDICGGYVGKILDITNSEYLPQSAHVVLTRNKLDRLIGYVIDNSTVTDILIRLGFKVDMKQAYWNVIVPSWRFDIQIEEDLIEEVTRVYGYDNIPNVSLHANLIIIEPKENQLPLSRVKAQLVDRGYHEIITYSFVDQKIQGLIHPGQKVLTLTNPISVDMSVMRISLLTGLLTTVLYNQKRQQNRIRLFESGLSFIPDHQSEYQIHQKAVLAGVITGYKYADHWSLDKQIVDFFDLKGDLEAILELTGKLTQITFRPIIHSALHPGQSAGVYLDNEHIGIIGVIHPNLEHKLNLNGRAIVFEISSDAIKNRKIPYAKEISRYPSNRRDISIIVPQNVSAADVVAECKKISINHIVGINLFDVYCGKEIANGYKSLAISLFFQDMRCTMEEKDIKTTIDLCVAALQKRFSASLRD